MADGLKILVVEDEVIVSEEISEFLISFGYDVIAQANSAKEALASIERGCPDVALLDINIKGDLDGIELAKIIRKTCKCAIIFLTAYSDEQTIARAKEVHPEAYLVKPFEKNGLYAAVDLAFDNYYNSMQNGMEEKAEKITEVLYLKDDHVYEKVKVNDILYLEANGSYCNVITNNKMYIYSINLKSFIEKISHPDLIRAHRSYLINIKNIDSLEGNLLVFGRHQIQMSQSYRENVLEKLNLI